MNFLNVLAKIWKPQKIILSHNMQFYKVSRSAGFVQMGHIIFKELKEKR